MNDDELRDGLSRRASGQLSADERNDVLRSARLAAREPRRRSFIPRVTGLVAGAAALLVLVIIVAPVLLSPPVGHPSPSAVAATSSSPSASAAESSPSVSPSVGTKIYGTQELADMIGDPTWVGRTVLAQAELGSMRGGPLLCDPLDPCTNAFLVSVSGQNNVSRTWRDATADDARSNGGVQYDDGNGYRWVKLVDLPPQAGVFAFTVRDGDAEYLGPAYLTPAGEPVTVGDIQGISSTLPSDGVIAVKGWLTKNWPPPPCPEPQLSSPKPAMDYYCYGTWLTPAADSHLDQGVQVQNDAYEFFAANPSENENGVSPQQGTYLVRNAGCPEQAPCPAFRLVGRLDGPTASVQPTSPPPLSPSPEPSSGSVLPVLSAQGLADKIGDPDWVGKTVLADAQVKREYSSVTCNETNIPCRDAYLQGVAGADGVSVGIRDAKPETGYPLDTGSGTRWVTYVDLPPSSVISAFKIYPDLVEFLGPATSSTDGSSMSVPAVLASAGQDPTDDVYVVSGWLTHTLEAPCAFPAEGLASPMPDISSYYCGGSWLTDRPAPQPVSGLTIDGGLHVQNDAYSTFAVDPQPADGGGYQPRQGVYLVRNAGCPEVVTGDCPVLRMVGLLDDGAKTPIPSTVPPPTTPVPPPLPNADVVALQTRSWPNTICDDALLTGQLVEDPTWGLAVQPSNGDVVGVIWPNGFTARREPLRVALIESGTTRAVTGDVVNVGGGMTADNAWAACGQIELAQSPSSELHISNQTTLLLNVEINDQSAGTALPGQETLIDPVSYSEPWHVVIKTESGRTLVDFRYVASAITVTPGGESGVGTRVDLSCGRLDVYAGPPMAGPGPPSSFPPGDCDP